MTPRERRYLMLQDMGCICCLLDGRPDVPSDMNHLVDKGTRDLSGGDAATIPMCPWHHRGVVPEGHKEHILRLKYGPSLRLHKKDFKEKYGTERSLLLLVDKMLAEKEQVA